MQPHLWQPPIELSQTEQTIVKRVKRAKLFVFLREHRHEVFNAAFQEELAGLYRDSKRGQPPIPPAQCSSPGILRRRIHAARSLHSARAESGDAEGKSW